MFVESLALYLCVTAGNALAFFSQSAYMRAAFPVEERLGISSKIQVALSATSFCVPKKLHHIGFRLIAVSLSCGVKRLFSCQPIIPQVATLEK
jgi:hypothetical protein